MSTAINRASPTLGVAIGYFAITLWAIPKGYIPETNSEEAVAMAGIVVTNLVMEIRQLTAWIGGLFSKKKEE